MVSSNLDKFWFILYYVLYYMEINIGILCSVVINGIKVFKKKIFWKDFSRLIT